MRRAALLIVVVAAVFASARGAGAAGGWTTMPGRMTMPRSAFGLAAARCTGTGGQCLYAVGGFSNAGTNLPTVESESEGGSAPSWTGLAQTLVTGRAYLDTVAGPCPGTTGLASSRQCLYAVGGATYGGSRIDLGSVEYLDPGAATPFWRTLPSVLTTSRAAFSATTGPCPATTGFATARECIYVVGGFNADDGLGYLRSVEYFDPSAPGAGWRELGAGLLLGRSALGALTAPCPGSTGLPGAPLCLYAIGGYNAAVGYLAEVEYLDPSALSPVWQKMPGSLETPRASLGATTGPCPATSGLASASRCVYAVAGVLGSYLASVEVEDPSAGVPTWKPLPGALGTPRGNLRSAVATCPAAGRLAAGSQCLLAVGGTTSDPSFTFLDTVELLDPSGAVTPGATIALSKSTGAPGLLRTVAGSGFSPGEVLDARWNALHGPELGRATAGSSGAFDGLAFRVPATPAGDYGVYVTGETSGTTAFAVLRVGAVLRVAPTSGAAGSTATVTGKGYGTHDRVTIRWDCGVEPENRCSGIVLGTVTTDANGTFSISVAVPSGAPAGNVEIGGKGSWPPVYADVDFGVSG